MSEKITIPCHTSKLKEVRDFVSLSIKPFYLSEQEQFLLVLAVDEICANRILHSNHNDTSRRLEVEISSENGSVVFSIKDEGDFFDLNLSQPQTVTHLVKERKKGGLGISLIKKIIDSVEVFREGHYTIHRLVKKHSIATQF